MAATRPILGLVSLIVLAGGIVLQFLTILSGAVNSSPVDKVYFLQASTNGVTNGKPHIPNPARWTFFALCGEVDGHNGNCFPTTAALPFNPPQNFGTTQGLPAGFIGTHHYFLISRFMWAFYLIALFFAVVSLLFGLFAMCARLGSYLGGLTTMIALFFQAIAAALMTAWTVQGRNAFRKNGQNARLGVFAYGFMWGAVGCFLVSTVLFCVGGRVGKGDSSSSKSHQKKSFFSRKRSTRSRGSFRDSESGGRRGIKDDYD